MADLQTRVREAEGAIRVDWSDDRAAGVAGRMHRRGRRRATTKRAVSLAVAALVLVGIGWAAGRVTAHPVDKTAATSPTTSSAPPVDGAVHLSDGTTVTAIAGAFRVHETTRDDTTTFAVLDEGAARFDVAPKRTVRVVVGTVSAEGSGSIDVVRTADGATVTAHRGRAMVAWAFGMATLEEGETRAVPPPAEMGAPTPSATTSPTAPAGGAWRALAGRGDYAAAYDDLRAAGPSSVRDVPEELLLAADVARLSGHAADATGPLKRVMSEHRGDPRAPLAAFTLGRVELDQLGRPRDAAASFAAARALDPNGALAEDALAREVEAWARAGDPTLARERADAYVAQYPTGRNLRTVRAFGGMK